MQLITAKLARRATEDGLLSVRPEIPLGKEYLVDMDSLQVVSCSDLEHKAYSQNAIVWAMGITRDTCGWIALELLEFAGEVKLCQ